jgi:exopolysaccharide biosynthesis polyprenyl glycosylphosphotransferase
VQPDETPTATLPGGGRLDRETRLRASHASPESFTPTLVAGSYKGRDYYLRRLLALGDLTVIILALGTASSLTSNDLDRHLLDGLATLPVWLVIFKSYGLYERDVKRIAHTTIDDIPGLFHALLVGGVLCWLYYRVAPGEKLTFITLLLFAVLAFIAALAVRTTIRGAVGRVLAPERVILIGTGAATRMLVESLGDDRRAHVQIVGRLITSAHEPDDGAVPILGRLNVGRLARTLHKHKVSRVLVAEGGLDQTQLIDIVRQCRPLSVKLSLLPEGASVMGPSVEVDDIGGLTMFGINPPVLSRSSRWAKRGLDLIGASGALLLGAPVLLLLALLVRIDSRGPAFFRQERIGRGAQRFKLLKLRTMDSDAESRRAGLLAQSKDPGWLHLDHDPRITRLGRLLRLTSLDELPQLWNVLRGDMSLVGPRPLVPEEDSKVQPWARGRLDLTPGITGLWQVLGRTSIPFEEMVKLDYLYVTNWTLWGDVRLILRTLPALLTRRGAN